MNLDPKAEDYFFQSTYAMAVNNPIYFVDINGEGVLTDYKLDKKTGKTKRVDENDGSENNTNDRLFSTDDEGNVNEDDFVQIDKENASDETLITELSKRKINKATGYGIRFGETENMENAFKVFKFAAENSDVEFLIAGLNNKDGSRSYFLGTVFQGYRSPNIFPPGIFSAIHDLPRSRVIFELHSHPNTPGGSKGDLRRLTSMKKDGGSMPLFYVYHVKTNRLIKYTSEKSNVFEKKIDKPSDFYTGKYK